MKRLIAVFLALLMVLLLVGCGSSAKQEKTHERAFERAFPTYSMYYFFNTEEHIAYSFGYSDNEVWSYGSGSYIGNFGIGAEISLSNEKGESWTEKARLVLDEKTLYVSLGDDPTEYAYKEIDPSLVKTILEKSGYLD